MEQNKHDDNDKLLPYLSPKYPWFIVQNFKDLTHQFFSTLHNPSFKYECRIPELSRKRIHGCFHGWIILSNHPHNDIWSLWNPSANNIISLPPLILKDGDYDSIAECCLSAPPDDPSSILLFTITNKPTFVFCQLSAKRKKSLKKRPRWTEMSYAYQLKRITWNGLQLHSLTCCNGQIYALCTENRITFLIIRVEIVVKDKEVVIRLLAFGAAPGPSRFAVRYLKKLGFLTGTRQEMFAIVVGFRMETDKTPCDVYLYKLDMTRVNWEDLECLKKWDMTRVKKLGRREVRYMHDLKITEDLWEEVNDLKDAIFVLDLSRDNLEFYNPAISSELGGYIHIHDKMGKVIYSYHVNDKTIVPSPVPSSVLPTSHMSMWEYWLEDDHREAKFIVDSKQEKDEIVSTLVTDNEVDASVSRLLDIPFDVLEMIMKFCVGVEYLNFRATCKRCHLAAPLIQWGNDSSLTRLQDYSLCLPWLMAVNQIQGIVTFTDPMSGDNYFMRCPELSIAEETICCSRFGWLLFKVDNHFSAFYNPFTNEFHELPRVVLSTLWFSDPPTSPDCMVVGISNKTILIHYGAREPTWHVYDLVTESRQRPICFPTLHGGDLYALYKTGELMVFKDLGKENISWEVFKTEPPRSCSESPAQYFLVKRDQHLLLVVMVGVGEPIDVYKLNDSTREWEKINDIGKHMIYICDTTCLCIEAKTPEMENKIYLSQLTLAKKKIVFYSLETCTFHTFNGTKIQEKLVDVVTTSYLSAHTWIEPSWSPRFALQERGIRALESHTLLSQ